MGQGQALVFQYLDLWVPPKLYLLDDTNGIRPLAEDHKCAIGAVWSPDGTQLVYAAECQGPLTYYLVDAQGENRRRITDEEAYRGTPRWSPDGTHLAYEANTGPDDPIRVHITEATTGETWQLPVEKILDFEWLPEGGALLIARQTEHALVTEVYNAQGTLERPLEEATRLGNATAITLSPDGRQVAYVIPLAEGDDEALNDPLYVAALDGSDAHPVGSLWIDGAVVWSPDSSRIAFVALNEDYFNALYVVNADGTGLQEVMALDTGDESGEILPASPAWSPDGTQIAISSYIGEAGSAIFVIDVSQGMSTEDSARRQVATASGLFHDIAWRPGK